MNPILYDYSEQNFTTNGLGRLTGCVRCTVHEVLNGVYELEMVYPVDGEKFAELKEGRIIYAIHDDTKAPQPFEIYRISRPLNGKVTVNAWHISYKLRKIVCRPFTSYSLQTSLYNLVNRAITVNPFSFTSDKTTSGTKMEVKIPTAVRPLMGGVQGSIIDTYGGEWEFDKWNCVLRNRRGQDTDVSIRYGKNLSQLNRTSDMTNLWSGVVPYWNGQAEGGGEDSTYYSGIVWAPSRSAFHEDMVVAVDCSSSFESKPTQEQMATWAQGYISSNARAAIPVSTKISFVQLWQTEEYKDVAPLQRLFIGDRVNVYYPLLGVDDTARIVEYTYNVLTERYDSMTLGEVRANIAQKVKADIEDATKDLPTKSFFEAALDTATQMITGGLGGYVVLNRNANGEPEEILVMNTADKSTATKVIRINKNGIGFGNGYNGPFNSAWTIDGTFDAQQINVINLNAASITSGILKDANSNTTFDLSTGALTMKKGSINLGNGDFKVDTDGSVAIKKGTLNIGSGNFKVDTDGSVTIKKGSLNIGSGKFVVDSSGNLTAKGATLNEASISGYFHAEDDRNTFVEIIGSAVSFGQRDSYGVLRDQGWIAYVNAYGKRGIEIHSYQDKIILDSVETINFRINGSAVGYIDSNGLHMPVRS